MNEQQQQFYNFFMSKVKEDKLEEAKLILLNNFKMQDEGTFTRETMTQVFPKLLDCIKTEHKKDFENAASHFATTLE